MSLLKKMFGRKGATLTPQSRTIEQFNQNFDSLFDAEWEVFVIKRDSHQGKFEWYTQCCEAVPTCPKVTSYV